MTGRTGRLAVVLVLALALAPIPSGARGQPAPCPAVEVPAAAARLVAFRPGPSRGPGDMTLEAVFAGASASCLVVDDRLTVQLRLEIVVERGPANQNRRADLAYFVALADARGEVRDKWIFAVDAAFGERTRLPLAEELQLQIPGSAARAAESHRIYIGFQLSREQLRYNRAGAAP